MSARRERIGTVALFDAEEALIIRAKEMTLALPSENCEARRNLRDAAIDYAHIVDVLEAP